MTEQHDNYVYLIAHRKRKDLDETQEARHEKDVQSIKSKHGEPI